MNSTCVRGDVAALDGACDAPERFACVDRVEDKPCLSRHTDEESLLVVIHHPVRRTFGVVVDDELRGSLRLVRLAALSGETKESGGSEAS